MKHFLLKRRETMGDVFLLTVCVKALKKRFPDCKIDVATYFPEVLQNNPNINGIYRDRDILGITYDNIFDLNDAYEINPRIKIAVNYLNSCNITDEVDTIGDMWFNENLIKFGSNVCSGEFIVFEASKTNNRLQQNRFFPRMNEVHDRIKQMGFKTMIVGINNASNIINSDIDFTGKLNLMQTTVVIAQHGLVYIGYHGGMAHLLQAIPMPTVIYYTVHSAEFTQTINDFLKIINVKTECFNCRSRFGNGKMSPWPSCYHPEINCSETISVDELIEGILEQYEKFKGQINERRLQVHF
jgi:ADP-heptose:LPS heptosyltransferase